MNYPKLVQYTKQGFVVLFTNRNTGMVVHAGPRSTWPIGHHSRSWWPADDADVWSKYDGTVELGNIQ